MRKGSYRAFSVWDCKVVVRLDKSLLRRTTSADHAVGDDTYLAGNKAWKLQYWERKLPPPTRGTGRPFFVSHGGPQSNAMLALAQLAHTKQMGFVYYTKGTDGAITTRGPATNLGRALALGMDLRRLSRAEYDLAFVSPSPTARASQPNAPAATPHQGKHYPQL